MPMSPADPRALTVVQAPAPVLSTPTAEVDPLAPDVVALAEDLVALMRVSPGCVGIAANQAGVPARLFVADVAGHKKARSYAGLIVLASPRLLERSGREAAREGCLSVPDLTGDVPRASSVVVAG